METTKSIQQLLFRTIDGLRPEDLANADRVEELLLNTALEHSPYLYASLCRQIQMLLIEYCGASFN